MATERERDEELDHLLELRETYRARKRVLEVQVGQYGRATPAHIRTELEECKRELERIAEQLPGADAPAYLDRMSADEQRKYLVALVMTLQADFVACRARLNHRAELLMGAVIVLELINLVVRALT